MSIFELSEKERRLFISTRPVGFVAGKNCSARLSLCASDTIGRVETWAASRSSYVEYGKRRRRRRRRSEHRAFWWLKSSDTGSHIISGSPHRTVTFNHQWHISKNINPHLVQDQCGEGWAPWGKSGAAAASFPLFVLCSFHQTKSVINEGEGRLRYGLGTRPIAPSPLPLYTLGAVPVPNSGTLCECDLLCIGSRSDGWVTQHS